MLGKRRRNFEIFVDVDTWKENGSEMPDLPDLGCWMLYRTLDMSPDSQRRANAAECVKRVLIGIA